MSRQLLYRLASSRITNYCNPIRCHSTGYDRETEEYRDFRRNLKTMRGKLLKNHRRKIRMSTMDSGSRTSREARMEIEREQRALEANEIELKRMAAIRYEYK